MKGRLYNLYHKFGGYNLFREYFITGFWYKGVFQILTTGLSNKGLEIFRLSANFQLYKYLKKKYWKYIDKIDYSKYCKIKETSDFVWVCWFQGMENAPFVVQRCYESLQKNLKDKRIVLLTEENISDWVSFPNFIWERYRRGCFTKTHLTDLLRLELLEKYGGIWIDSTVLLTDEIPQYITNSNFFVPRCLKPGRDGHAVPISSWLMVAKSNNKIIITVKELMYEYWRRNNKLINYFLIHQFIQMALDKYPEEEVDMIKYPNSTPHILLLDMFYPFNPIKWNTIKSMSSFHKLAYKRSESDMNKKGTYYDEIIVKGNI